MRPCNLELVFALECAKAEMHGRISYRTLSPLQFMLNLNGRQNLDTQVVVLGISGRNDLSEIMIEYCADFTRYELGEI